MRGKDLVFNKNRVLDELLDEGQFIHLNFLERDNYQKFLDFMQLSKWSKLKPLVSGYDAYYQELSTYAPKEFIEDYNQKLLVTSHVLTMESNQF